MLRSGLDRNQEITVRNQPSVKFRGGYQIAKCRVPRWSPAARSPRPRPRAVAAVSRRPDLRSRRPTEPVDTTGFRFWSIPSICVVVTIGGFGHAEGTRRAANSVCSASAAWAVNGALQLRMKRSAAGLRPDGSVAIAPASLVNRPYQVAPTARCRPSCGESPACGQHFPPPPDARVASDQPVAMVEQHHRNSGVRGAVVPVMIAPDQAAMFACVQGTIGRSSRR